MIFDYNENRQPVDLADITSYIKHRYDRGNYSSRVLNQSYQHTNDMHETHR